jgi:hypothetical protein
MTVRQNNKSKTVLIAALATVAAVVIPNFSVSPAQAASGVLSAYTLVTPKSVSTSRLQVRAIIPTGIPCPQLTVTTLRNRKINRKMAIRVPGATTGAAFASLRACQSDVPAPKDGVRSARVGGITVPSKLPATFTKIAMIGDTGCRIDGDEDIEDIDVQDCTKTTGVDPADYWPLATNARSIAREKPDMTVFTGDFYYREDPCPTGFELRCGGSPAPVPGYQFNDTDYGWMADVFIPMAPVFQAAPVLAVRGNHEQCDRGGNGWYLFFEVSSSGSPAACAPSVIGGPTRPDIAPSWFFDAPIRKGRTLRIVAVDSAYGKNFEISDWVTTQRLAYETAAEFSRPVKGRESWLVTHRPMFGIEPIQESLPGLLQWTSIDQTAAGQGLISNYQLMVASHVHVAQVVKIPGQPPQMVVGNGGSKPDISSKSSYVRPSFGPLATATGAPLSPDYEPYPTASYDWTEVKYGYVIATPEPQAKQWTMTHKDFTGQQFATCSLAGKQMACN